MNDVYALYAPFHFRIRTRFYNNFECAVISTQYHFLSRRFIEQSGPWSKILVHGIGPVQKIGLTISYIIAKPTLFLVI